MLLALFIVCSPQSGQKSSSPKPSISLKKPLSPPESSSSSISSTNKPKSALSPPGRSSRAHARSPSSAKIEEIMAKTPEGGKQNSFPAPKKGQSSTNDLKDIAGKISVKPRTLKRSEIRRRPRPAPSFKTTGSQNMPSTEAAASTASSNKTDAKPTDVEQNTQNSEAKGLNSESKSPEAMKPLSRQNRSYSAQTSRTSSNGTSDAASPGTKSTETKSPGAIHLYFLVLSICASFVLRC